MASVRAKPPLNETGSKGRVIRRVKPIKGTNITGPILSRLTVVWVQRNGVPFNTTGFFAQLFRGNRLVQTASFDRFGVVRFSRVRTLTNVSFTIRVFSSTGVLFRVRTIPAGVEVFAIIG